MIKPRTADSADSRNIPVKPKQEMTEANPFLGYRAVRICLDRQDLFKPQLRAILRAGAYGNVKVMFPMIASLEELRAAVRVLDEAKQELREQKVEFNEGMAVGMMIEVPAAALIADALAKEVSFFSIGTNDLIQYTLAADRNNEKISGVYTPYHPAVLRLVKMVADAGRSRGIWVGICGEASGDEFLLPFWLGIGLDELSMSAVSILKTKEMISKWTVEEAEKVAAQALAADTARDVLRILQEAQARSCSEPDDEEEKEEEQ